MGRITLNRTDAVSLPRDISQWVEPNLTIDVNTTSAIVQVFGTNTIVSPNFSSPNVTLLDCLKDGVVRACGCIPMVSTGGNNTRFNGQFQWLLNGSPIGPTFRSNYMRRTTGHDETSQELTPYTFEVSAGDQISLRVQRVSGSDGTVDINDCVLEFEYVG